MSPQAAATFHRPANSGDGAQRHDDLGPVTEDDADVSLDEGVKD
jgi:hypothetical protein